MAAGPPSTTSAATEDIRKMGQLVKIKTNKKKYFVLRDETRSNSARLEYYDSEKKWRAGTVPKRTVVLKDCFNIHAKADAKHRHAIALYTKDDCFSVSCRSEDDQQEWLAIMIELRNRNLDDENTITRPLFEHVWPVTVKSKGLGGVERKVIPGQYRLCLTNTDLSLVPTSNDRSDIILPLDCIRRCGHANQFFFLELGRQAITGSGNLWLQVEDMVISQNIHEALLSSMKKTDVPGIDDSRIRSSSFIGGSTPSHAPPKRTVSSCNRRGGRSDGRVEEKPGKSSDRHTTNLAMEPAAVGHLDAGPKQTTEVSAGSSALKLSNPTLGDDGLGLGPEAHGSSSSVSSVISSVGSASAVGSSEHSIHSLSRLQEVDGGYIEMSIPQNPTEHSNGSVRPAVVPCYVRKDGADARPKRAYSVGSKPLMTSNKPLNSSYIDMSGTPVATKDAEKSSSVPYLNDDDDRKRELSDLFMELDFDRSKRDCGGGGLGGTTEVQERTSGGASPRGPQAKSAASFGAKDAAQKPSAFARNKSTAGRPRTSTVCQEMLRPRTSSFGPSDHRPRSSSGGNVMSRQLQDTGGRQSSRDSSFQSHGKRASQKNAKPGKSDAYMSMSLGKRSTDWPTKMADGNDTGYMDMKPAERKIGDSDYLKMTAGATGTTAVVSTSGENSSARSGVGMMLRQRLETVQAGSGEDYLEMTPENPSQSKAQGTTTTLVQPKVKVTRSLGETASCYMQMAPRGASIDRTVRANPETKDVRSSQKNDSYMEMSFGSGKHGKSSSASGLSQCTGANSRTHTTSERARGSAALTSSPDRDGVQRSGWEQNVSPHEALPPPPFQLSTMIPSQTFLLRTDHAPTIPTQPSASGTVVHHHNAADGSVSPTAPTFALDSLPGQISYATLDLGSSVDRSSTTPPAEGRRTGSIGRVRGLGRSSRQHVYAQIDFETSEDCQK